MRTSGCSSDITNRVNRRHWASIIHKGALRGSRRSLPILACAWYTAVACSTPAHQPSAGITAEGAAAAAPAVSPDRAPLARTWFFNYLHAELPILLNAGASDWEKVNAVREWAYRHIPRAAPGAFLDNRNKPPEVLFEEFERFQGGFACGGTAELLRDLYIELGYDAYTYDMGTRENDLSHMLTVVRIEHEGQAMFVVQDAYFNFTLRSSDGSPLDLRDLFTSLERRDLSRVQVASGTSTCKPVVTRREDADGNRAYHSQYYEVGSIEIHEGMARYCHDFSISTFEGLGAYTEWVRARVGSAELLYLFLFPIGTSGGDGIEPIVSEARRVKERLMP